MIRFLPLFLLSFSLFSKELHVQLPLKGDVTPVYLSAFESTDSHELFEEERKILEHDLNVSGVCHIVQKDSSFESKLRAHPDTRMEWVQKKGFPLALMGSISNQKLTLQVIDTKHNSQKNYGPISLTRKSIHQLADQLQNDLFQQEGIASLELVYTQRVKNPKAKGLNYLSEIWISESDGENAKQITHENSYCLSPALFPGKPNEIFYASEKNGQSKIYRTHLTEKETTAFINLRGNQALPSISKDGSLIAFIADAAGRPDLFVQKLDAEGNPISRPKQFFSAYRATQASPTFSPDGKKIAFVSDMSGPPRIYVMEVNGKKKTPRVLTKRNRENTCPSWSPDGTKLAYSAKVDGVRQIWIYDFARDEEIPLTDGPENKENPSWAPNSLHLVYNTESQDECDLYLIHIVRKEPIPIQKGRGQKRFASWYSASRN